MTDILLCNQSMSPQNLRLQCGVDPDSLSVLNGLGSPGVAAYTPYLLDSGHPGLERGIRDRLSCQANTRELTQLALSYGGDNVVALAEIREKLHEAGVGLISEAASFYDHRVNGFVGAVKEYEKALLAYRKAARTQSPVQIALKQQAHRAFEKLQTQFQQELRSVTLNIKARRGTPLTRAERGTNIARSSRSATKLHVADEVQASKLVRFSRYTKFLGNGLAVIDFGSRAGRIQNAYQAGGNWEREMFIESSSFAFSAAAGTFTMSGGSAALGLLVAATPVGWIGLVIGGLAVAGTAAAASIAADSYVKENAGSIYDEIMSWL
ncbi:hypothetical protein QQM79_03520 [Marinobacteraceae bacterium S3BR75-40.1]